MYLVFDTFNASLLAPSQSHIFDSSQFRRSSVTLGFTLQYNVVSSAYINMVKMLLTKGKSFIYINAPIASIASMSNLPEVKSILSYKK